MVCYTYFVTLGLILLHFVTGRFCLKYIPVQKELLYEQCFPLLNTFSLFELKFHDFSLCF